MAFTLGDWNDILNRINALIANNGLSATPLPLVVGQHRWSVTDIVAARNKLTEIGSTLIFVAPLVKWTQVIIDELNEAIDGFYLLQAFVLSFTHRFDVVVNINFKYPGWGGGYGVPGTTYAATCSSVVGVADFLVNLTAPNPYPGYYTPIGSVSILETLQPIPPGIIAPVGRTNLVYRGTVDTRDFPITVQGTIDMDARPTYSRYWYGYGDIGYDWAYYINQYASSLFATYTPAWWGTPLTYSIRHV